MSLYFDGGHIVGVGGAPTDSFDASVTSAFDRTGTYSFHPGADLASSPWPGGMKEGLLDPVTAIARAVSAGALASRVRAHVAAVADTDGLLRRDLTFDLQRLELPPRMQQWVRHHDELSPADVFCFQWIEPRAASAALGALLVVGVLLLPGEAARAPAAPRPASGVWTRPRL